VVFEAFPALPGWAKVCRAYGACISLYRGREVRTIELFPISALISRKAARRPVRNHRFRQKNLMRLYLFVIIEEMPKRSYLGDFELMILLAVMRLGDDAYGVPISREIQQQSGREVALATVYAALERLAEKGLVSSELGEPTAQRGGRAKRYFHPTKRGLGEVREARAALINLWRGLRGLEGEKA
jgi:PadR family transcriptional regulator PadR